MYEYSLETSIYFLICIIVSIIFIIQIVRWSGNIIKKLLYLILVPTISVIIFLILAELSVMIVIRYSPLFILSVSIIIHLFLGHIVKGWIKQKINLRILKIKLNNSIRKYINLIGIVNEGWVRIYIIISYFLIAYTIIYLFIGPFYLIEEYNYIELDVVFGAIFLLFLPTIIISVLPKISKLLIRLFRWIIEGFKKDNI